MSTTAINIFILIVTVPTSFLLFVSYESNFHMFTADCFTHGKTFNRPHGLRRSKIAHNNRWYKSGFSSNNTSSRKTSSLNFVTKANIARAALTTTTIFHQTQQTNRPSKPPPPTKRCNAFPSRKFTDLAKIHEFLQRETAKGKSLNNISRIKVDRGYIFIASKMHYHME